MKPGKSIKGVCFAAALLLCLAAAFGCASPASQGGQTSYPVATDSKMAIEELPAQAEYQLPDPASQEKVRVQVPEGYECSEYLEDIEPYTGKALKLEAMTVDMGKTGSLHM